MVTPCDCLFLLLSCTGGPALPGSPFRLDIPYQVRMDTPLPEVHPPGFTRPDLLGLTDTQRLRKDNLFKDEEPLRFPTPAKDPPP